MSKYKIADLIVEINPKRRRLINQAEPYRVADEEKADFQIDVEDLTLEEIAKNPEIPPENIEYILSGADFMEKILCFDGLGLHSSAVVYDNAAYLFSAPSGVGKSTHTQLWRQYFGAENTLILNDDKPVMRRRDGFWYAFGTPWSGSTNFNVPIAVPLRAIAFIERSNENWIRQISPQEAIYPFLNQTLRPFHKRGLTTAIDRTILLLKTVPFFQFGCRPELDAVYVSYEGMKNARPFVEIDQTNNEKLKK